MKYIIHTCKPRLWYVNKFLKPSLIKQGIRENDIIIWLDKNDLGNLRNFLNSLIILPNEDYIWHLQDDIIICSDFKQRAEEYNYDIICGYYSPYDKEIFGEVAPENAWYSFQCIKMPTSIQKDFLRWYQETGSIEHQDWVIENKFDDSFFHEYLKECYNGKILNLNPNLVDNVDYLLGGSLINKRNEIINSKYFYEQEKIDELKLKILGKG